MSITVDYFFNYPGTISATGDLINESIGSRLSPYEGDANDLYCRFLGMELNLLPQTFENDGELNFQDFCFHLSFRTSLGAASLREMQLPGMALIAYSLLCAHGFGGMLVFDGQVLLARYEERHDPKTGANRLFDTVSNEFVIFPHHLSTLEQRVPERY
jgi:hypothetical protein